MPTKDLTIGMVGSGGDGVVTMGEMIAQAAAKVGLHVIKDEAYGPQIRGGESSCTVRISADPISAQGDAVSVMVVFGWGDFARFKGEMIPGKDCVVLYEASDDTSEEQRGLPHGQVRWVPTPFMQLAKDAAGTTAAKNIVTLGILCEYLGLPHDAIRAAIAGKFGKKKAGLLETNLKGFEAGVAHARTLPGEEGIRLTYVPGKQKLLMSGNEATGVGALHAGCRFFAGYPITPSSEVLHFLSEWMPKVGGRLVQTEDELSAYGAVLGGSYAGVKSFTATSGPGLSLMTEMLGLSSIAEIPSVIYNVQRGGPSTGIPTKSEQSDLWQSVFGSHGDAPRVVIAPVSVEDHFHAIVDAFNISEEFQIPVIVQSDQSLAQRRQTIDIETLEHDVVDRLKPTAEQLASYERYADSPTGVSPMSVPGTRGGSYQTNGLEHDACGGPNATYFVHERMNEKRYRKLRPMREKYHRAITLGAPDAEVGILCWGSSYGPVDEVVTRLNAQGRKVAAFIPQMIYPFPKAAFETFLKGKKKVLLVEISYAAQFYKYLRTFMDFPRDLIRLYKRSGGWNLTVSEVDKEIVAVFEEVAKQEVLV